MELQLTDIGPSEDAAKRWEKIESKINQKIESSLSSCSKVIKGATPEKIVELKQQAGQKIIVSKNKLVEAPASLSQKINHLKSTTIDQVQSLREDLNKNLQKGKEGKWSKFGIAASLIAAFEWALIPVYKKLTLYFSTISPGALASGIVLVTVSTITGIGVYNNSTKIAQEAGIVDREPASIERPLELRPKYYKRSERELLVANVIVPSYIEGKSSLRKLQIDFTIISSNRYIREYLFDNTYLLEDMLNSKVEPIIPGFPLSDEGKLILKEKIKAELNQLLLKMKIKGSVEQIYISSILAA